jgi:hypothetical protein
MHPCGGLRADTVACRGLSAVTTDLTPISVAASPTCKHDVVWKRVASFHVLKSEGLEVTRGRTEDVDASNDGLAGPDMDSSVQVWSA